MGEYNAVLAVHYCPPSEVRVHLIAQIVAGELLQIEPKPLLAGRVGQDEHKDEN